MYLKYITDPELFVSQAVQKCFFLFDNGVEFELCNCLNGEVMNSTCYSPEARFSSLEVSSLDANKSFTKNNIRQTFKGKVFLYVFSIEVKVYFLHQAQIFLENWVLMARKKRKSTLELCWHRQIWDDRGFEFFCALKDDHKWVRDCWLEPERRDEMQCIALALTFFFKLNL